MVQGRAGGLRVFEELGKSEISRPLIFQKTNKFTSYSQSKYSQTPILIKPTVSSLCSNEESLPTSGTLHARYFYELLNIKSSEL